MTSAVLSTRAEHERRSVARLRHHLGDAVMALFADPDLIELSANPDGTLWADRLGTAGMVRVGEMTSHAIELTITSVAAQLGLVIDRRTAPELSGELPAEPPYRGARFQALLPPAVDGPTFTVRMRASAVFPLAEYVARGIMRMAQREAIEDAIGRRQSLLVVGATASGKSTLLNAILAHLAEVRPLDRVACLEDTTELQIASLNRVQMHTTGDLDMDRLLKITMRQRPDFVVIGEVRDRAALSFVKALGTGHPGACTVHAGTARGALRRLESLIQEASVSPQRAQIAEAIDLIVCIRRDPRHPAGRCVPEVSQLASDLSASGDYVLTPATE